MPSLSIVLSNPNIVKYSLHVWLRFVELLHRKMELAHPRSFTLVTLDQLLRALQANQKYVSSKSGQSRNSRLTISPVTEILSDYYLTSSTYSEDILEQMKALSHLNQTIGFSLRAGLLTDNSNHTSLRRY